MSTHSDIVSKNPGEEEDIDSKEESSMLQTLKQLEREFEKISDENVVLRVVSAHNLSNEKVKNLQANLNLP